MIDKVDVRNKSQIFLLYKLGTRTEKTENKKLLQNAISN